jgi:hypothetical protein
MRFSLLVPLLLAAGCGDKKAPETPHAEPTSSGAPTPSATAPTTTHPATTTSAAPSATASAKPHADDPVPDDPNESAVAIEMKPLFDKKVAKTAFPKATAKDGDCWKTVAITGDHRKDFASLVDKCGTPTGLAEYAKPADGHLHHVHDKRDTFTLKLASGFCYRYFAVADAGIKDIDILVEKVGGAIVADNQSGPVAIIEGDKPWCMTEDITYEFHIEVDGVGKGRYTFGVWARPKG